MHAQRLEIEAAVAAGGAYLTVAKAFGIKRDALRRHMEAKHVGKPAPKPAKYRKPPKHPPARRHSSGPLSAMPSYDSVSPPGPVIPEPAIDPAVPLLPWVRLPSADALIRADKEPLTIPNAYTQLEGLRGMLEAIINAPEPKGADGEPAPEWVLVSDRQYRLGAMRELRATIAATLKLWEAQRAIEERYKGTRPLHASEIVFYLRSSHPEVLAGLLKYLQRLRIDTSE
jgi:hypothetical protein